MNTHRQPRAVPSGGQFKARSRSESDVVLTGEEPIAWPAVGYESLPWNADYSTVESRNQRRAARGPYRATVVPEIADLMGVGLPSDVALQADDASTEIARFDQAVGSEIAPFSAILLRSESAASSEIEELTAGAKAIAMAEIGDRRRVKASLIAANTSAMNAAIRLAGNLDENAIIEMHAELLGGSHPEWTGHWRDMQVWVGGFSPHSAKFVPPSTERVPANMSDLVRFIARDDLQPFVQAAIAHAQFETIHPFPDGNGRVGRAIIHALLKNKGLTTRVTVPVSAGLLVDTGRYFEALTKYREGDPAPIVEHMAQASFSAIDNGRRLVDDIRNVQGDWHQRIKARSDSGAWRLAELLLRQPAVDSPLVQHILGVRQPVADRAIGHLVETGILAEVSGGKRNRRWVAEDVTAALDAFAERAGRRHLG